jgi:hypothetical protein
MTGISRQSGIIITASILLFPAAFHLLSAQERPRKKLIEFGWDVPYPAFVRDHIREMETRPFDGIIFRTKEYNHAFDTRPWTPDIFKPDMDALAAIKWGKFTDNFLTLYAANTGKMDWFNDAQWNVIEVNMRLFSHAAVTGRCVGVCFDNEPYGNDPWVYTGKFPGKTYDEVAVQVRKRGRQFMTALQTSLPDIKVLHFFQLSYYGDTTEETRTYRKETRWDLLNEPDRTIWTQKLSERWLALFYPFFLGMLDAAGPKVTFIDGNEFAYYYDSPDDFYRHYYQMKQSVLTIVPPELRPKHSAQVQAGNAVYFDILATGDWGRARKPTPAFVPSNFLTPEERLRFLEHNVYYSLVTADEYVWFYSEHLNWWRELVPKEKAFGPEQGLPSGVEDALIRARTKWEKQEPLGFDISEMISRGWEMVEKAYEEQGKK